jgi:hypothetical protein
MAFTFRLYLENGEDIGTFATAAPDAVEFFGVVTDRNQPERDLFIQS